MKLRLTYYPDITQKQTEEDIHRAVTVFSDALGRSLSRRTGETVEIETPAAMSVRAQFDDIITGGSHIALMKPVAYVFAHRRDPQIVPACVAQRLIDDEVGIEYFGQIYARASLGLKTLEDLRRAPPETLRIAYGNRFSTSNFLVPANLLKENGIHPFLFFRSTLFAGGHDLAAEAVYDDRADIGTGHDGVITILAKTHADAADKLIRLGRENIHSDPVVVNQSVLPGTLDLKMIQEACVEISEAQDVKDALELFWGWVKGLSPTRHQNYASIERALASMALDETDMLS